VNPKAYSKAAGVVLLLVGVVGLLQHDLLGMDLSKRHSAVHLVTGALLAFLGFTGASESLTKNVVLLFGVVYTILGVWGFFTPMIVGDFRLFHTDVLTNCIHLAVGLAALAAAMMGGAKAPARA
jgi:hypothetical protein